VAVALVEVRKLAVAAVAPVGLPEVDNRGSKAAASSSMGVAAADMADVCREARTICNNRNLIPSTNRRHPGSKPTGSIGSSIVRRRPLSAWP
jgi:hypothetical protein